MHFNATFHPTAEWVVQQLRKAFPEDSAIDLLDFGEALDRFSERYPRKAHIVELRVFGGLTVAEVGNLLGIACQSDRRFLGDIWSGVQF